MKTQFVYTVSANLSQVVEVYKKTEFFIASMKHAGARTVELLEEASLADGGRRWRAKITESSRLPVFLRSSDILVVVNESTFSPSERRLTFRVLPSSSAVPVMLGGDIDINAEGDETSLRYHVNLAVRLPLISRRTESLGLKIIGDECRKQAALVEAWATARQSEG